MSTNICNTFIKCAKILHKCPRSGWPTFNYQQIRSLREYQVKMVRSMYWRDRSFDRVDYESMKRNQWSEWNFRSEIYAFSRRLHENLSEDTLRQIFTHLSYVRDFEEKQAQLNLPSLQMKSNEELIQRGHHLLIKYLKPYLRFTFSRVPEDGILQITSYLSSDNVLSDIALWIGCKDLILSKEYPLENVTMANTVRALVAGIDSEEPDRTRRFIVDIIVSYLNDKDIFDDVWLIPNPKETLNLILANSRLPTYEARIMFETGVKTVEQCHVVGLYTNQKYLGSSAGETLQIAEDCAALEALKNLFNLKDERPPFLYGQASEGINYGPHEKEHEYIETWRFQLG